MTCPGCGHPGDGDDVLANNQRWCPDTDCPVVSFHADREGGLPRLFDAADRETFREAAERWGVDAQAEMAEEECAELIVASKHWARGKADEAAFIDELADVAIMREQLAEFIGRERVEAHVRRKMDRLRERLDEAKEASA